MSGNPPGGPGSFSGEQQPGGAFSPPGGVPGPPVAVPSPPMGVPTGAPGSGAWGSRGGLVHNGMVWTAGGAPLSSAGKRFGAYLLEMV